VTQPQSIAEYRVVTRLGAGTMTETYEAVKTGPGGIERRARVQWLFPSYAQDAKVRELVLGEAQMAMGLRHRGILSAIDFGEHEGSFFLAFDHVDGLSLEELLASSHAAGMKLPTHLAVLIATDLAEALSYAHSVSAPDGSPVLHRDISPERILLSRAGEVLLTGFGLGGALQKSESTRSHFVRSNAWYMAPEQVAEKAPDVRADLYSLGCVLFEMLAGRRPFEAASDLEAMLKVSRGERPKLADVAKEASSELTGLVETLMAKKPADRMASAADLTQALSAHKVPHAARRELAMLVADATGAAGPALSSPSLPGVPAARESVDTGSLPGPSLLGPSLPGPSSAGPPRPGPAMPSPGPAPAVPEPGASPDDAPQFESVDLPEPSEPDLGSMQPVGLPTTQMAPFELPSEPSGADKEPATLAIDPADVAAATDGQEPATTAFTPLADQMAPSAAIVASLATQPEAAEPPTMAMDSAFAAALPPSEPAPPAWTPSDAPQVRAPSRRVGTSRSGSGVKIGMVILIGATVGLIATMIGLRSCDPPPPPAPSHTSGE